MLYRVLTLALVAGGLAACQSAPTYTGGLPYGAAAVIGNSPIPVNGAATCVPGCTGGVPVASGGGDPLASALAIGGGASPGAYPPAYPDNGAAAAGAYPPASPVNGGANPGAFPPAAPDNGSAQTTVPGQPGVILDQQGAPADVQASAPDPSGTDNSGGYVPPRRHQTHYAAAPVDTVPAATPAARQQAGTPAADNAPFVARPKSNDPVLNQALTPAPVSQSYGAQNTDLSKAATVPGPSYSPPRFVAKTDLSKLDVPNPNGTVPARATAKCQQKPDGSCVYAVPRPAGSLSPAVAPVPVTVGAPGSGGTAVPNP